MTRAIGAVYAGFVSVVRVPGLLLSLYLLTVLIALPFGVVVGSALQQSLVEQSVAAEASQEFDAEWWQRFYLRARGLSATFTPSILGFGATLENLSAVLDGDRPPLVLVGPLALAAACWMFLWGGILQRFWNGTAGLRAFVAAAAAHFPRFAVIGLVATAIHIVLYLTLHAWLFGPVYERLAAAVSGEPATLACRLVLYFIFGLVVIAISLLADYTRLFSVVARGPSLIDTARSASEFVRRHFTAVFLTYALVGTLFLAVVVSYGAIEAFGGSRVGGWRAVVLGQVYVGTRIAIRVLVAGSEVALVRRVLPAGGPGAGVPGLP